MFAKGKCAYGDSCLFNHPAERVAVVCVAETFSPIHAVVSKWIGDTGAATHLINQRTAANYITKKAPPIYMETANGSVVSEQTADVVIDALGKLSLETRVLESTPNVLSIGRLVKDLGYSFRWNASEPDEPYLISKDGQVKVLKVENYVPVFALPSQGSSERKVEEPGGVHC